MPTTPEQAYETVTDHFFTYWQQYAPLVYSPAPEIRWKGVEEPALPKEPFVRFTMQEVIEGQTTLRDGENGQRYTNEGLIFVQVFVPRDNDTPAELLRKLSQTAKRAFRGRALPGGIWFRRVRVNELEPENKWYRNNVIAEYRYDEVAKPPRVDPRLTAHAEVSVTALAELT